MFVNNEKYTHFTSILKAVEACFKVLIDLNSFPFSCDYVWMFIQKLVYRIEPKKSYKKVSTLISLINKRLNPTHQQFTDLSSEINTNQNIPEQQSANSSLEISTNENIPQQQSADASLETNTSQNELMDTDDLIIL